MDKSTVVVVEESHLRCDVVASVVKPLGSLVQISSITIDLGCAMEEVDSPMHEHFSIRGYVSGMRKKDSTSCLSSALEGGGDDDGDLPPLSIPKFRWWKCSTCAPETSAKLSDHNTSSCPHDNGEQTIGVEHGSSEIVNEDSQLTLYNPPCNEGLGCEKEADVMNSDDENARADVAEVKGVAETDTLQEDANIRADEPKIVTTECDELSSKKKPKLRSLTDIMHDAENTRAKSASADLVPQIRAPHKKRKLVNVVEEDIVPTETATTVGASKRSKGPISASKGVDTDMKMKNNKRRVIPVGKVPKISAEDIPSMSRGETKQVDRASDLSRTKKPEVEGNNGSLSSYRGIPDLNESLTERPSMMQGNELPAHPDCGNAALHSYTDACKQNARNGKRQIGLYGPQVVQEMPNNVEPSDDIPMDIVELLAMNQRERALGNSSINNSIGTSLPAYVEGLPGTVNFSFANARSGINIERCKTGVGQGASSFPQMNREDSQFSLFGSYKPSQQKKPPFSASSSLVLEPRPAEGADLLWPSMRNNVHQRHLVQPSGLNMHSFSDHQRYKGKTVAYMHNEDTRSARDAYSNDTIPAMQLLSLMNRGVALSSNGFLDKPASTSNLHRRLNGNKKQFFTQSSRTKEFPTLVNGVRYSGESSKRSYTQGQVPSHLRKVHLGGPSNCAIQPPRGNVASEVCTLNRNPADFGYPDAKNEFTITWKDLKFRKRKYLKESSPHHVNVDYTKRRKAKKVPVTKSFPAENIS